MYPEQYLIEAYFAGLAEDFVPPEPKVTRHKYIQECPFCHVIHEHIDQFSQWCEEHEDKKLLWERRPKTEPKKWKWDWACPGCDQCEDEKERLGSDGLAQG